MRKINKKGAAEGMDILVILLTGLITLALLLGIIFRADLLNWMRNLPDYGKADEDRIIDIGWDREVINATNCDEVGELISIEKREGIVGGALSVYNTLANLPWYAKLISPPFLAITSVVNVLSPEVNLDVLYTVNISDKQSSLFVYSKDDILYISVKETRIPNIGQLILTGKNPIVSIDDVWIKDLSIGDDLKLIDDGFLRGLTICKKIEKMGDNK